MISDGFGNYDHDQAEEILAGYEKWLHSVARQIMPWNHPEYEDTVQEGRIAMWRALATFDRTKGALPTWLTGAARMRMQSLQWGHGQPFGREATRGTQEAQATVSIEALVESDGDIGDESLELEEIVFAAYHHGEIMEALRSLSDEQREYVVKRFWGGVDPNSRAPVMKDLMRESPTMKKRWLWSDPRTGARQRLQEILGHLMGAA